MKLSLKVLIRSIWVVVIASVFTQCTKPREATPGPIASIPVPTVKQDVYVSFLTGGAYGSAQISGSADDQTYGNNIPSSAVDTRVDLNDARQGLEDQKSCGSQWTKSQSRATTVFTPSHDPNRRVYGFALAAQTFSHGGFWRGRIGPVCKGSNNTTGQATATVSGKLDLAFHAQGNISDKLIVRVNSLSMSEANLKVIDGNNTTLPLTDLPNGAGSIVELSKPGPYTITASISVNASNSGASGSDPKNKNFQVSVQSMRDALSLGYGQPATESVEIPVPIYFSTTDISDILNKKMFTDDGKFFPCKDGKCDNKGRRLYLEYPTVSMRGGALVIDMHLSGHYDNGLFSPGLTGNIRLSAVPVVRNGIIRLEAPLLEIKSRNFIVKYASKKLSETIEKKIAELSLDTQPRLDEAMLSVKDKFPLRWGGACLRLNPSKVKLSSITLHPAQSKEGLTANFRVQIETVTESECFSSLRNMPSAKTSVYIAPKLIRYVY